MLTIDIYNNLNPSFFCPVLALPGSPLHVLYCLKMTILTGFCNIKSAD